MFPCWDEPRMTATFNITAQHNKKYTVYSNTEIESTYVKGNFVYNKFHQIRNVSAYQIAITAHPRHVAFSKLYISKFNVLYYREDSSPHARHMYATTRIITTSLTSYLRYVQNFKITQILIPEISTEAIATWGHIVFRYIYTIILKNSSVFQISAEDLYYE